MRATSIILRALGSILALAASGVSFGAGAHGGAVATTRKHQFEAVFRPDGLAVYPLPPAAVTGMSGTATFTVPGAPKPFVYRLAPGPGALVLAMDLGKVPTSGSTVTFQVAGLPDPAEPTATFTVPFALAVGAAPAPAPQPVAAPAPAPATLTFARSTAADRPAIDAQKTCRVSGEVLGSMGPPLKVMRGRQVTYLCCKGCLPKIQADPDRYLGKP